VIPIEAARYNVDGEFSSERCMEAKSSIEATASPFHKCVNRMFEWKRVNSKQGRCVIPTRSAMA
jgi:hypothetical protein